MPLFRGIILVAPIKEKLKKANFFFLFILFPLFIMKNVKEKEGQSLEEMVLKYKPIVTFRVKKALRTSRPDWEDVVNEIIAQVVEKIKSGEFRGESSIGTFIYTIASRRIVDYIREKTRELKFIPEPSAPLSPMESLESKEREEMVANAIGKLKPKYREILYLAYYKEFSRFEIAQCLKISPNRVSERLHYAYKLLKKMLSE